MLTTLGTLTLSPATEHPELLARPVVLALATLPNNKRVGVAAIDPSLSDTASFCEHYEVTPAQAANCVIVESKRGVERFLAAVVLLASTRADINGAVRAELVAKKVSFAQMEKAVTESGMEYGAITPIGLPVHWPILIDQAVADSSCVIIGSGLRSSKLAVPGALLATLPNARIVKDLAHPRS